VCSNLSLSRSFSLLNYSNVKCLLGLSAAMNSILETFHLNLKTKPNSFPQRKFSSSRRVLSSIMLLRCRREIWSKTTVNLFLPRRDLSSAPTLFTSSALGVNMRTLVLTSSSSLPLSCSSHHLLSLPLSCPLSPSVFFVVKVTAWTIITKTRHTRHTFLMLTYAEVFRVQGLGFRA